MKLILMLYEVKCYWFRSRLKPNNIDTKDQKATIFTN